MIVVKTTINWAELLLQGITLRNSWPVRVRVLG